MKSVADTKEFQAFFAGCQAIFDAYWDRMGFTHEKDKFSYTVGRRYIKIIRGNSVHAFVDTTNGDVLKPASWKVPAKHARGNIYNENNGLGLMGEYGPAYLK